MSKKIFISILVITFSIALLGTFSVANEEDFITDTESHSAKRAWKSETVSEDQAIKAAKKELKTKRLSKYLRSEINVLYLDKVQSKLVHLANNSKVKKGGKYVIEVANKSEDDDIYLYAYMVIGKKVVKLFPNEDDDSLSAGDSKVISGDEAAKFNKFYKGKVVLYFFLFKKSKSFFGKKLNGKKLEKAYKRYNKGMKLFAAKVKEDDRTVDELDSYKGDDLTFDPLNVWFSRKLARKVVIQKK